jgi:hypothetical protein
MMKFSQSRTIGEEKKRKKPFRDRGGDPGDGDWDETWKVWKRLQSAQVKAMYSRQLRVYDTRTSCGCIDEL